MRKLGCEVNNEIVKEGLLYDVPCVYYWDGIGLGSVACGNSKCRPRTTNRPEEVYIYEVVSMIGAYGLED